MEPIHERHRPATWREFLGNARVVSGLKSAFRKRAFNRYVFSGAPDSGKTTLARICAAELGAGGFNLQLLGPDRYRRLDFLQKLKQNLSYGPLGAGDRIWIFEDAQELPRVHQQVLADMAAELAPCDFFIFCTPALDRLDEALLGQCVQVELKPLSKAQILKLLERVCRREQWTADTEALEAIAARNRKNPRLALVELETRIISGARGPAGQV